MFDALEAALWQEPENEGHLQAYQQAFRDNAAEEDGQHRFIIVIPVADRPHHLQACLASTLTLCERFGYGGIREGRYHRVEVLIADDSNLEESIQRHRQLGEMFTHRGLRCHYFGQAEQLAQLACIDDITRKRLAPIIGDIPSDQFGHKGASIMRNIASLKLREMVGDNDDTLIYFIDSDQEFQVKVATAEGDQDRYAINYLYQLDRIFRETNATILTGKVVGDPPVSPSVMAGKFLDDVIAFLQRMRDLDGSGGCSFHDGARVNCDDAAYHDMADLFGFKTSAESFDYPCDLAGEHNHSACLNHFAAKLGRFFDGEHPTRKSYYTHQPLDESIVAARTVYTGNYCFRAEALRYFIPFAALKLRMAGPVLGRIIKAEIGERFVSANLPMLHKRTVDGLGESEFRPGIERRAERVDLSGEYERQFFGDVMLFTMERLTAMGYPQQAITEGEVRQVVEQVERQMLENYTARQQQIVARISTLRALVESPRGWWQGEVAASAAFERFLDNMEENFGERAVGFVQIQTAQHRLARREAIIAAIRGYRDDRLLWQQLLHDRGVE
ncbi:MAG: hypothetical protein OEZ16_07955 [Chromatiales bacterium]|nr:hypothetical protein [Chromatiales bacterium]